MQAAVRTTLWTGVEERLVLSAIFLLALLVRLVVVGGTIGFHTSALAEGTSDSRIHIALVQSLLNGRGYSLDGPTAITPPLYILFLASLYRLFDGPAAVRLVQIVLGAAGCVVLYAIGRRVFDQTTGLLAAGLLSLNPLVVYLAGLHLTESLFLFLVLLLIWQSLRVADQPTAIQAVGLGGLLGLAMLVRAIFVAFLPFVFVWAVSVWGIRTSHAYRVFAVALVSAMVVIMPWTVRNYLVLGAVVPVQSNGGMVFWASNNPRSDGGIVLPTRETWTATRPPDDNMYGWRDLTPTEENRLYVRTALSWIREHPRDYMRLLVRKFLRLYGFTRAAEGQEVIVPAAVQVFHAGFLAAALAGLLLTIRRWRTLALLLVLIVFTNLTTLLFGGATRYTIPMIPSLALLAATALVTGWHGAAGTMGGAR